jgi:TrmH RNA methyltransferase
MAKSDTVIYGVRAALAVAAHRPQAIRRVLFDRQTSKAIGPLLKATAAQRKPYREAEEEDLRQVANTVHHEGVVVVATPLPFIGLDAFIDRLPPDGLVVALDGVRNPHNQGAILRTAAWFGATGVVLSTAERHVNSAAIRVSQGGAEMVPCVGVGRLGPALRRLRERGYALVAADQEATQSALEARPVRPVCLVMGNEAEGLARPVLEFCDRRITIPGTGAIESLNVSVAAGILMSMVTGPLTTPRPPRAR